MHNSLGKSGKVTIFDPDDPHLAVRQLRHLRMEKVKTRGKLGNLTFQDGGQLPPDLDNLDLTWGIPNWKIPTRKNTSDTYKAYAIQKAYLPMHGSAWQFRQI